MSKTDENKMKLLRDAVTDELLKKIASGEATSQDMNTAVRLIQNYNIDLEMDKEEDQMTDEEKAMLNDWAEADLDPLDLPPSEYED